jgi:hypothetical protein
MMVYVESVDRSLVDQQKYELAMTQHNKEGEDPDKPMTE